jgi:hypothetical protein
MDNETIDVPPAPKKPYVTPQLHVLAGSDGAGKLVNLRSEAGSFYGPS